MSTFVLRLGAPLMAWGHASQYRTRHTAPDPTLSALQGLAAAAAGVRRGERRPDWVTDLDALVRVDTPGTIIRDFQTINPPPRERYRQLTKKDRGELHTVRTAEGNKYGSPVISERFYVSGATYVVLIDDPDGHARDAFRSPVFALYAGRKSCPLSEPFVLGTVDASPAEALTVVPTVLGADQHADEPTVPRVTVSFDGPVGHAFRTELRNDRASSHGEHLPQERHYQHVNVPIADSWFAVIRDLQGKVAI